MIRKIKRLIKEIVDMIMADCGNCIHENRCPFVDKGTSCWEQGKGDYYIKRKE